MGGGNSLVALRADDVDFDRDATLVERFQDGDEQAFADLYERYFSRVRRYCQRRLGDPHEAEEAAQDALVRAYRALPSFGGDRRFYPWLRVIAANVCTDRCRRRPDVTLADPTAGDVVVDSVFERMDHAFVRAAMRDLNPRHQTALSLWAEGEPSRRIAEELGCSTGAVDVTLHRARQSLRDRFLAITGDGKLAGIAVLPAVVGRWAHRWRARIVTRAGEHAEFASPLAVKLAAGALAFTVVGGAVATGRSPQQVSPTAPPPSVVQVQTSPASASSPLPASASSSSDGSSSAPSGASAAYTPTAPSGAHPSPPTSPLPVVMSAKQAKQQSSDAPIKISAAGTFVNVDPRPVTDTVRHAAGSGGS